MEPRGLKPWSWAATQPPANSVGTPRPAQRPQQGRRGRGRRCAPGRRRPRSRPATSSSLHQAHAACRSPRRGRRRRSAAAALGGREGEAGGEVGEHRLGRRAAAHRSARRRRPAGRGRVASRICAATTCVREGTTSLTAVLGAAVGLEDEDVGGAGADVERRAGARRGVTTAAPRARPRPRRRSGRVGRGTRA